MTIVLRRWADIKTINEIHVMAQKYKALNIRRRRINDWVADTIWFYDGEVKTERGRYIDVELVRVDHHLQSENDASCRWYSDFVAFAEVRPKQQMHSSLRRRYTLLWLAMALHETRSGKVV